MPAATVPNVVLNYVRDNLSGAQTTALKATWFAIGTSTQGTPATALGLATETFRKPVTSYSNGGAAGEGLINCYLAPSEAVGTVITEIALFGGAGASVTPGSGTLVFYALYSHTHTALESIQIQWDSTI